MALTFVLLHSAPGDPVTLMLGPRATAEQLAAQRRVLGLDRPLPAQFGSWIARFATGDWGTSIAKGRPVRALLGEAWPATARLVGLSLLLSYVIGLFVGAVQAARSRSRTDTALSVATVTLFALPGYWLALMLVLVFTYWARVLPAFGAEGLDSDYLSGGARVLDHLRHLALPLVTLTLIGIGGASRFVRGAMLETLATIHHDGAPAWTDHAIGRHVAQRSRLSYTVRPVVPALFSKAVFIEATFGPASAASRRSGQARDYCGQGRRR